MCGLAGIFDFKNNRISPDMVAAMIKMVDYRGPDGEGFYHKDCISLAHKRLAIIDLSNNAAQPMTTLDNRYTIVYNGEVYNFKEIRKELIKQGFSFVSQSDTEVVLKACICWKEAALDYFNGMFSFALWDAENKEIFLARDRYGIKPLYYSVFNDKLFFASEIKSILATNLIPREIDKEALLEYFTFQNIFTNKTLFKNINLLEAGCWMRMNLSNSQPKISRYWDYSFEEPQNPCSKNEYIEELDFLFQQAVKRQLVSDVDVGSYLSGGIDSGSITAVSASHLPYMKSFTVGFDLSSASGLELGFDEREKAEYMSYLYKTEHYEMVLKAGDMERILPELVWHLEDLRVGQSYPNFYAAKLAGKFVKVVLSGAGGDELFGGYPWRYYRAVVNDNFDDYIDKYYLFWQRLISNNTIHEVFSPIWKDVSHVWTRDIFKNVFLNQSLLSRPEDYINHSLYFEAKTFLHGLLLVEDKLSMAHGLESRVPFLDNDLVDFAMKIPVKYKLSNLKNVIKINENEPGLKDSIYFQKTNDGKLILRDVMSKYVPDDISKGVKQGFSAPDASWFKGASIEYVKSIIYDKESRIYSYFDQPAVEKLVEMHLKGELNQRLFIWSLLNFEWWCRKFL